MHYLCSVLVPAADPMRSGCERLSVSNNHHRQREQRAVLDRVGWAWSPTMWQLHATPASGNEKATEEWKAALQLWTGSR